ncbi:MAG: protein-glutamate O-methyltransferase CheR [Symploca sp. SIO3C6]|uniref:protein-glutamate O-methyltransferase n=1 Tax=Symploca sp. SIO1C4 TaxID=2607765 RepID=A0A6B3N8L1_9CYAN|nr:protein-glutamate O-methyltransferase CheR [Symploca sp. SIO3C6]NER27813.1 protein-glutamate O-methyltransferase CheR [Symploca sp. SIO1C4]
MSKIEPLSVELKQAFIHLIAKRTGLAMREREQVNLNEKIFLRMKILKISSPGNYYQLLEGNRKDSQQEWQQLVLMLTNLESYFFRDKEQFKLLRNNILPELIQRHHNDKTIRICSAGCSTGEEPYSLAILLKELIQDLEQWHLIIVGIDINQEALKKAETGIYRPWSFRGLDTETKQRYFRVIDNQYHLEQQIKQMVKFKTVNLVDDSFPRGNSELRNFDLIICRNVFIYFESLAISKVLEKFYCFLQPSGYLLTGHTELYNQNLSKFKATIFPESIAYQRHITDANDLSLSEITSRHNYTSLDDFPLEFNSNNLDKLNIQMQRVAINLLGQLPPDTRIYKLGNLTAAELITKIKIALREIDQETK